MIALLASLPRLMGPQAGAVEPAAPERQALILVLPFIDGDGGLGWGDGGCLSPTALSDGLTQSGLQGCLCLTPQQIGGEAVYFSPIDGQSGQI